MAARPFTPRLMDRIAEALGFVRRPPEPLDRFELRFAPDREPSRLVVELYGPEALEPLWADGRSLRVLPDGQVLVFAPFRIARD